MFIAVISHFLTEYDLKLRRIPEFFPPWGETQRGSKKPGVKKERD
jgi:hypothetical protein